MESLEKTNEEGFDFIQLFLLPISLEDYFLHKNQIDLFIRKFKVEHSDEIDQWKFEIKHILPAVGRISDASNSLMQKTVMELKTIIEGKQDFVLPVFSKDTFVCRLDRLPKSIEDYLCDTLGTPERRESLENLCNSSLSERSKLLIGVMMAPYVFLLPYIPLLLKGTLKCPTIEMCNQLIDYAISLGNSLNAYQKLSAMCNAVFAGATESDFLDISTFIQESVDKDGNYDEVLAMKKINEYFCLHKNIVKAQQKKIGEIPK